MVAIRTGKLTMIHIYKYACGHRRRIQNAAGETRAAPHKLARKGSRFKKIAYPLGLTT